MRARQFKHHGELMYLTRVNIKDVRCCDFEFNFEEKAPSILLCGDNGDGKSTVLRCIAMGLCDETSAAGLLRELQGDFVRKGKETAHIELELRDRLGVNYKIRTEVKSLETFERLEQTVYINGKKMSNQDDFPWQEIFVSAYGPGNRISGISDYQHYVAVDAVYHLFKNDLPLQNPELVMRRIIDDIYRRYKKEPKKAKERSDEIYEYLRDLLKKLLNLDKNDRVKLARTGIKVKSERWGESELGSLGDGYRSTVTWIMDLLSWWMLYLDREILTKRRKIRGIVLIDELEQHLHPKWQIRIMQLLHDSFKGIQFIATTHSPLVISGSGQASVIFLKRGKQVKKNVHGWLSEDVYQTMGLDTSRALDTRRLIKEYEDLHFKKLQSNLVRSESMRMEKIKQTLLAQLPSDDPIVLTSELENLSRKLLKNKK